MNRRTFTKASLLGCGALAIPNINFGKERTADELIIGHGDFQYKVQKDWGTQSPNAFPVKDCHEMVEDAKGRLILLTNETRNNVLIYDKSGKVLSTWGHDFPGAHGLTLHQEGEEEFLYITDTEKGQVYKTTMGGKIVMTLDYPKESGAYSQGSEYHPTETAIGPNGDIYVADGYGKSYVIQYSPKGEYIRHFAGQGEADYQLKQAHGICLDTRKAEPELLVTSRAAQEFKRFSLDGEHLETIATPGCWICRPVIQGNNLYFAVIVTKTWDAFDGLVIVMDENNKVISAPGGSAPSYIDGQLQEIAYDGSTFLNPHDVCIDRDQNIYVPQWASNKTYPVKLERI